MGVLQVDFIGLVNDTLLTEKQVIINHESGRMWNKANVDSSLAWGYTGKTREYVQETRPPDPDHKPGPLEH
jgi:hypothetical protein